MEKLKEFNLNQIPHHSIVFAMTSDDDYEMERILLVEDWPDFIIVEGSHCSCYDFDDTEWYAYKYTREEIIKLMAKWITDGIGLEKRIAPLILRYVQSSAHYFPEENK